MQLLAVIRSMRRHRLIMPPNGDAEQRLCTKKPDQVSTDLLPICVSSNIYCTLVMLRVTAYSAACKNQLCSLDFGSLVCAIGSIYVRRIVYRYTTRQEGLSMAIRNVSEAGPFGFRTRSTTNRRAPTQMLEPLYMGCYQRKQSFSTWEGVTKRTEGKRQHQHLHLRVF